MKALKKIGTIVGFYFGVSTTLSCLIYGFWNGFMNYWFGVPFVPIEVVCPNVFFCVFASEIFFYLYIKSSTV